MNAPDPALQAKIAALRDELTGLLKVIDEDLWNVEAAIADGTSPLHLRTPGTIEAMTRDPEDGTR